MENTQRKQEIFQKMVSLIAETHEHNQIVVPILRQAKDMVDRFGDEEPSIRDSYEKLFKEEKKTFDNFLSELKLLTEELNSL